MTERLTPSELVYLFVDGEATGVERTEMYAALATDSDLQAEFEDALRLKQTVDDEIAATVPPLEATKELFLKAGFTLPVPVAGGEALAPAVSHIADSGLFTALKSIIAPFFVTTGIIATGIVSMPFFDKISSPNATGNNASQVAQVFHAENTTNAPLVEMTEPVAANDNAAAPTRSEVMRSHRPVITSNAVTPSAIAQPVEPFAIVPTARVAIVTNESTIVQPITPVTPRLEQTADLAINEQTERMQRLTDLRPEAVTQPRDFLFGSRGIAGLALYPSRGADGAKNLRFNNLALTAEYQVTPTARIGLAAGTETFPHYIITNDTSLTEKWNIVWAGASYAISAPQFALGPLVPSASLLLGGAATGPLGKFAAALSWQPDDRVSFTAGIETTGLLYHFGTTLRAAGKIGATYGVAVRF
jgi:hypothetical protein